eukprot:TRINITY_DN107_c0_g1_i4.p1 TRINITY_DN107_c0_g1~~TRINITY_DN107_c0_g1_i4.p1  ORF type:complete len:2401 (-),score=559.00 TRINITY_DN107_c0_g1_i4:81-7283(-)
MDLKRSTSAHNPLHQYVEECKSFCQPDKVHWCTGSQEEYDSLCEELVKKGTFTRLNAQLRPNSFLARSDVRDTGRVEDCTFVCSKSKDLTGKTNNWRDPNEMRERLDGLFRGCMKGRTMYVVPFCMGPIISPFAKFGVEITDSAYVAVNMRIITRMGADPLKIILSGQPFLRCLHSVGKPLGEGNPDVAWPCNPDKCVIALFPEENVVQSFGSGFGANSLVSKRLFGLRMGSVLARNEHWLAEHCLILSLTSPEGKKYNLAAAFITGTGKTNLATLVPTLPGWTVRCVSDDVAWLLIGEDGRLYELNPENGFFDRVHGTSYFTSRAMMDTLQSNAIFTNVGLTEEGDVWWDDLTKEPPVNLIDWTGQKWTPGCGRSAAHENARYTVPASQCPVMDPEWENPNGVPICAIVFGSRRYTTYPLVAEAFTWEHGVLMGALVSTEESNGIKLDPFAMAPYVAYNIKDYVERWLGLRKYLGYSSPRLFYVNWFRKDSKGDYLWPGFAENSYVLRWICHRTEILAPEARRTAIGYVPTIRALELGAMSIKRDAVHEVLEVRSEEWNKEMTLIKSEFSRLFGEDVPQGLSNQLKSLEDRLHLVEDEPPTRNKQLLAWVDQMTRLCKPDRVYWATGTDDEYDQLCDLLVKKGTFHRLNDKLKPNSYLARSDPSDVARVESKTFICSKKKEDAGPTNNWADPTAMKEKMNRLFDGCMKGRTMYIIPFCMGPLGSPYAKFGVEVTDSPYVVVNMKIMTRIGNKVLTALADHWFLPCLHSVGRPLESGQQDVVWPCNPENTAICHFPDDPSVMSFGSGYGGNALLGKKCYSLRIASVMGRNEGWLAEHCLILGLTSPEGHKYYICAAFPSACGKTNLAMLVPTLPGWTVRCVGDDIAWLHVGQDGRLYAINPEAGFFGVAPGTSDLSNQSAMHTIRKNTIFTNVGLTPEGDVWWEGMTKDPPKELIDWTGQLWTPDCGRKAAHPNSRYTTPASQCPVIDSEWENPNGVPISALIFGGRRNSLVPLVTEAFTWEHGVFMGSIISSELTAAAEGKLGDVRRDPFAMLPFCGYNMGDYFNHWINFRKFLGYNSPKIFYVNWFRRDAKGNFLWPGFGENSRVLEWICKRIGRNPTGKSHRTPIGHVPTHDALDLGGLDLSSETIHKILHVDAEEWLHEIPDIRKYYAQFGDRLPTELDDEVNALEKRLRELEVEPPTDNRKLIEWVEKVRALCQPDKVRWVSGSEDEYDELCALMVKNGTFLRLNEKLRPNSYLARSDPRDVARVESKTFICSKEKDDAGPTNNWADPATMKEKMNKLFAGSMKGRTMYIIPFCMGPVTSSYSRFGVEITDSPYVVVNMKIMTRIGTEVLQHMTKDRFFLPCLHSVGAPLTDKTKDVPWPCDPENTAICHFPDDPSVMSFGSGYGGNALLGKKCYALRIASVMGRNEGWLAEHCLILGLTSPQGKKYYICAGFPSACGKTNLAMLVPTLPGWTVRCVGDDIAWLHVGQDGRLYAINPEAGFFGVAPGTSDLSNRSAMVTIKKNTIFTNVGLTPEGDVWWEGMTKETPKELIDWTGQNWTPDCGRKAAHPNSRYTTPASQCPVIDPEWQNPNGVPICAIVFGGRRERLVPLVTEAFIWEHGVFMGSIISSEQTAAAEGALGAVRRDPFAMLPFCGYNMGDYFQHWVDFRKKLGFLSPKIFYVNWFRKDDKGRFLWPGFGENSRVLEWICRRVDGTAKARSTPIGYVPTSDSLELGALDVTPETIHQLMHVEPEDWLKEIPGIRKFYEQFGDRLPAALKINLDKLEQRLIAAQDAPTPNKKLTGWVDQVKKLCKPSRIHWCTGTSDEYDELCDLLVNNGTFTRLNGELRPNSFVARSDPRDVGRVEEVTFVCSRTKDNVGLNNNWEDSAKMKEKMDKLFDGCMRGRTMYVIPFCMGPLGSPYAKFGVQITDSPYVVVNMRLITRMGSEVLNLMGEDEYYLPCLHSVGFPLESNQKDVPWPCNPEKTVIALYVDEGDFGVSSFGSNYGANALLSKRCFGLRVASAIGRKEGWLAEHCMILSLTSPEGKKHYIAAAFPTGSGKTSLAMMVPTLPGWTVRCVSDDFAWIHLTEGGHLHAINPEFGFFDRIEGLSYSTSRATMETLTSNTIFTNVATTPDGDVWWEGKTKEEPSDLIDWTGQKWTPKSGRTASHPNARYTVRAQQCPVIDPEWENPNGVHIAAFIFGGRRFGVFPLVLEAFTWEHGVFLGSLVSADHQNEKKENVVVRESFAMIPYNAYDIRKFFERWINIRKFMGFLSPKIFYVNWFRKDEEGNYMWPGFGENSRVLKWIIERIGRNPTDYHGEVVKTPIGYTPAPKLNGGLDIKSLDISQSKLEALLKFDQKEWAKEIEEIEKFYAQFGPGLPESFVAEIEKIKSQVKQ